MKFFRTAALIAALAFPSFAIAQTTSPVTPTISNGQVVVAVPDSSGGVHIVTFPISVTTTINTGVGTDAYTAPAIVTSVQATCAASTVITGASIQCSASVQGANDFNPGVVWTVSAGTISGSGLFTTPASAGAVTITATSVQDKTKSATVSISVLAPTATGPAVPSTASVVDLITTKFPWKACEHDAGTPGTATCGNNYPVTGIAEDSVRSFSMTYMAAGGVRWANSFAKDTTATNFVYDTQVISPDWSHVANLELDTNQVKSNGKTSILGTQCSSYSKTWEVTLINPATGKWHWVPSNVPCNPLTWTPNVLHHVRIFGAIDASGVSTYTGVELDGVYSVFVNQTGTTAVALGWSVGSVLVNLQIDGLGQSGAATVYSDRLTIYRW